LDADNQFSGFVTVHDQERPFLESKLISNYLFVLEIPLFGDQPK